MDGKRSHFRCDRCAALFHTPEDLNRHKFHKHIIKQSPTHSPTRSSTSFSHLRGGGGSSRFGSSSGAGGAFHAAPSSAFTSSGTRASLDSSKGAHSSASALQYQCRYCGLTFSLGALQEHVRTVHGHRAPTLTPGAAARQSFSRTQAGPSSAAGNMGRCLVCSRQFESEQERASHVCGPQPGATEARKSGGRFLCHLCDKTLSTQSNLREHINSYHRKERRYECPKCGLKFARKSIVTKHLHNIHGRQRRYKCPSCDATFDEVGPFSKHYHQCKGARSGAS